VFHIDIAICQECGGAVKVIACIEDPMVIRKILDHLKEKAETTPYAHLPECRQPACSINTQNRLLDSRRCAGRCGGDTACRMDRVGT